MIPGRLINNIYDEGELEQIATVWYKKKNREISWKLKKTSYLCTVDQNKQHLSDKRRKKCLTFKNSKIMVKKNEEESPRALKEEELQSVNGGGKKKRRKFED